MAKADHVSCDGQVGPTSLSSNPRNYDTRRISRSAIRRAYRRLGLQDGSVANRPRRVGWELDEENGHPLAIGKDATAKTELCWPCGGPISHHPHLLLQRRLGKTGPRYAVLVHVSRFETHIGRTVYECVWIGVNTHRTETTLAMFLFCRQLDLIACHVSCVYVP